jgi:hypothetical protein
MEIGILLILTLMYGCFFTSIEEEETNRQVEN